MKLRALILVTCSLSILAADATAGDPKKPDAVRDTAKELFDKGVRAADAGKWEECRAALLAAWNIRPGYQLAGNLAECEAKLGQHADAATHLRAFFRGAPATMTAEQRKPGEALMKELRAKVSELTLRVDKPGAEVFVDGRSVGHAPFVETVFVAAGERNIEAKLGDASVKKTVTAAGGGTNDVELRFEEKVAPVPSATPSATASGAPTTPPRSMVPAYVAGGVGVASLIAGGVLVGLGEATRADLVSSALRNPDGTLVCARTTAPGTEAPQCNDIRSRVHLGTMMGQAGIGLLIASGVLGLGAVGYVILAPRPKQTIAVQLVPAVSATSAGGLIVGAF